MIAGGVSRSHFLADYASVVVLLSKDTDDPKLQAKHGFFRHLVRDASASVPALLPAVRLLCNQEALETIREDCARGRVKPTDRVTFRIDSAIPLEQGSWHDWWREFRRNLSERETSSGPLRRCFVSGEFAEPERTHLKIVGLAGVGGQPSGDVLIGFDKDAFCSYGFSQGENACVSAAGMAGYRAGLNELLKRSQRSGWQLAGGALV